MENSHHQRAAQPQPQMTAEATAQLQEGISLLLSRWTALQMAVLNEWGGPHSRHIYQQFSLDILSRFTRSKERIYIDDIEDMLDQLMLSLNTQIDDGSIEEVAEKLMIMHEECLEGNFSSIKKLKETNVPNNAVSYTRQASSDDDDDDDNDETMGDESSEMIIDAPVCQSSSAERDVKENESRQKKETAEAEDGWTVVASKKNKGRRN